MCCLLNSVIGLTGSRALTVNHIDQYLVPFITSEKTELSENTHFFRRTARALAIDEVLTALCVNAGRKVHIYDALIRIQYRKLGKTQRTTAGFTTQGNLR